MASAPSPVTVLVEDVYEAKKAIYRGEDARAVIDRLHHTAAILGERADLCDSIMRVGITPYTRKKVAHLAERQAGRLPREREETPAKRTKIIAIRQRRTGRPSAA